MKATCIACAIIGFSTGAASAVPIIGGTTTIDFAPSASAIADFGVDTSLFGTATADGTVISFPITGGDLDDASIILHEGSGLTLGAGDASGTIGNFVIDTAAATVFGDAIDTATGEVVADASDLPLFSFGDSGDGLALLFTDTFAQAIDAQFGSDDADADEFGLAGATFGIANTDPVTEAAPVPVPAALPLMVLGLSALGVFGLRRRT